jgi:hypothetical protein
MVLPFNGGNTSKEIRVSFACCKWSVTFMIAALWGANIKISAIYSQKAFVKRVKGFKT